MPYKSDSEKIVTAAIIGTMAFLLNLEQEGRPQRFWHRLLDLGWHISFGLIAGLLFGDWIMATWGQSAMHGFIGACCFFQKPLRILLFKFLYKAGADPIGALERLVNLVRRK